MVSHPPLVRSTSLLWTVYGLCGERKVFLPSLEVWVLPLSGAYLQKFHFLILMDTVSSPFANGATFLGFEMAARVLDRL